MSFGHLHIHNEFSLLDGLGSANDYAAKAKELNQEYIALTNHGNIDGLLKFQRACQKQGIKPILGCEAYIVNVLSVKEKGEKRNHVTLLIKNEKGFHNLCKLLTIANLEGFYYKPRIDIQALMNHCEGLIVLSGCSVGILSMPDCQEIIVSLQKKLKSDFYLEVMPHEFKDQKAVNKLACSLSGKYNIPLVATNDCHYVHADDSESHEVLLAMQTQAKWADKSRFRFSTRGLFLCSEKQMRHKFLKQGVLSLKQIDEAINSTEAIASKCDFTIAKQNIFLPAVPLYKDKDPYKLLLTMTRRKLQELIKEYALDDKEKKIYQARLSEEWKLIQSKGFVAYFCIVKELIDFCKANDIMVGAGRGCFLQGTKIYQSVNMKNNIEDINIGENVISHKGEIAIVEDKFSYDIDEEIVDIYMDGELKISCTKDHRIFTNNGWKNAENLSKEDKIIKSREIYKKRVDHNKRGCIKIKKQWMPSEDHKQDHKQKALDNKRCKANEQGLKEKDKFYLSGMQISRRGCCISISSSKIWTGLSSYLQQMYYEGKCKLFGKIKNKFRSSKDSSEQTRSKGETKNCSIASSYKRPNVGKEESQRWENDNAKETSLSRKTGSITSKENVRGFGICKEMEPERVCFWQNKWHTISIFLRTLFFIELFCKWSVGLSMQIRNTVQKYKWEKVGIQTGFSNWGFGCRNKRLGQRGSRDKEKVCKNVLQEKWIEILYFLRKRFEEKRNDGYRYKFFNETKNIFYKKQSCYEMVEKIEYRRYKGKVYDLKTDKRTYNVEGYGVHNSVGGSLVAFLLGITCVDPIKYNLLFSRFINEARQDLPDIDLDFEDNKREQVKEHLRELYGENNIASISTFLTMKGKAVVRDVARVFDVPLKEVDEFAKNISYYEEGDVIVAACKTDTGKRFVKKYPQVIKHAIKLEGTNKASGQHAAACIISADDLTKGTKGNLVLRKDQLVSNWDMEDSEHMGLMKLDVLGLNTLTVLHAFQKEILKNHNKEIDFIKLPLHSAKVYKQIAEGNNVGIFQISGWATNKLAPQIQADNIFGLSDLVALSRPGVSDSGMTDLYIERRQGNRWEKKHPVYEEITKHTYGIIVYQEQVMEMIYKIAGLPYTVADKIRKIIAKKRDIKEFQQYEDMFIEGCLKQGYFDKNEAMEFWETLQVFGGYLFNKSHAIAYAITAYWTAWARCYYPVEYICALLNYGSDNEKHKKEYIDEAKRLNLEIRLPSLMCSDPLKWKAKDGILYVPFIEIKGVGEKLIEKCAIPEAAQEQKGMTGFFQIKEKPKETTNKLKVILDKLTALEQEGNRPELQKYFSFNI